MGSEGAVLLSSLDQSLSCNHQKISGICLVSSSHTKTFDQLTGEVLNKERCSSVEMVTYIMGKKIKSQRLTTGCHVQPVSSPKLTVKWKI